MVSTITITASLVLIALAAFFITFVINRYNKKFAGGTTILLGVGIATLGTTLPEVAEMAAICALIVVFTGFLVALDGWINKR